MISAISTTGLLLVAVPVLCAATALSPLTLRLLEEDLLDIGDAGQPFVSCIVADDKGATHAKECSIESGTGHRSVGCMAVWKGSVLEKQGCFSGQDLSLKHQCKRKSCVSSFSSKAVGFCCCFGHLCNQKYNEAE